jgi:hypothetical protein
MAKLSPVFNDQSVDINGNPLNGAKLFTYVAGSSTKVATYTDSAGTIPQTNPIILNSLGYPTNGPIWIAEGTLVKFVLAPSTDTDPPTSPIKTIDNVQGVNDSSTTISQWTSSGVTPTYVSATSFTLPGDQTSAFEPNRRLQFTTSGGTVYGTILTSVFTTLTTVTMTMDGAQVLDAGLSVVNLGILTASNSSIPTTIARIASPTFTGDPKAPTPAEGDNDTSIATTAFVVSNRTIRNFLSGLTMSTAGSSATMSISAGQAVDSSNAVLMSLNSAISKTTAAWAVGSANGGLDTGTIRGSALGATSSFATSVMTCTVAPTSGTFQVGQEVQAEGVAPGTTISSLGTGAGGTGTYNLSTTPGTLAARPTVGASWYYFYAIRRPDTGVVDVVFSLNSTTPTLPTNYTQYRYIGANQTNGSAQWTLFYQDGDDFYWAAVVRDVNSTLSTTATNYTLSVPRKRVKAYTSVFISNASNTMGVRIFDPQLTDVAVTTTPDNASGHLTHTNVGASRLAVPVSCWTSASGQVRGVCAESNSIFIGTLGWSDPRGKNS